MSGLPFPNLPEQFCTKCEGDAKLVGNFVICLICKYKREVTL